MDRVTERLHGGELFTFYWINHVLRSSFFDWLMPKITHLGGVTSSVLCSLFLLFYKTTFWHQTGVHLASSLIVSHLLVNIIKRFVRRRRPYQALDGVVMGTKPLRDASFPSGHSTAIFCIATVLVQAIPSSFILFYSLASIVAFSRVYLGMHYPSDIMIGASLGTITALLMG
ncbi:MAG TPA: phosphatase PAP2 family protein [Desulfitobacterium dehalogenans]|uniref:Phosphatase PAP2 family protein n=1 Tax=Desulfitobacterium dehalogenans TaxID=36854 RepID=A0A7C6Z3X2_9FIRM|nr:phosphatase PAP2 family protein [Desulfitobacterium dehalogenans]